jgi:hypothetical protein
MRRPRRRAFRATLSSSPGARSASRSPAWDAGEDRRPLRAALRPGRQTEHQGRERRASELLGEPAVRSARSAAAGPSRSRGWASGASRSAAGRNLAAEHVPVPRGAQHAAERRSSAPKRSTAPGSRWRRNRAMTERRTAHRDAHLVHALGLAVRRRGLVGEQLDERRAEDAAEPLRSVDAAGQVERPAFQGGGHGARRQPVAPLGLARHGKREREGAAELEGEADRAAPGSPASAPARVPGTPPAP